ncbi:AbrB/MazE/SpoVT family DNA-binding domain-containing protein [Legionella sp. W05-934-2]|jgi:antitoxin component of MazEF toxin-antitoxin module|uniref:AbrB/MazE/SpoVT family DNA-binding domain-containing protein n=1 Tax=Legionella sp. W05-934-2 TaxID=1198649 RepID=UPI0034619E48
MSTVSLKKWGNSVGVRIPSALLKEAHLELGEEMEITINENGAILLTPSKNKQEGWLEQFNAIANVSGEGEEIDLPNQFDEEDWTW